MRRRGNCSPASGHTRRARHLPGMYNTIYNTIQNNTKYTSCFCSSWSSPLSCFDWFSSHHDLTTRVAESACRKEFTSCASAGENLGTWEICSKSVLTSSFHAQQPSSVETQVPWEVSMTQATGSPPAFSSSSPAPSQRATASSDSRLVSNCFQTIRIFNRHRHRHHRQPAVLMNLATRRHRALPRGRAKCQRVSYPQETSHPPNLSKSSACSQD